MLFKVAYCDLERAVEPLIRELRGERVMLDSDLARIYGVPTKVLNQAASVTLTVSRPISFSV